MFPNDEWGLNYDRKEFKEKMKDIYNYGNYKFIINNNKINNMISTWKKNSNKFNKFSIFNNIKDKNGNLLLRDYRYFYKYNSNKKNLNYINI